MTKKFKMISNRTKTFGLHASLSTTISAKYGGDGFFVGFECVPVHNQIKWLLERKWANPINNTKTIGKFLYSAHTMLCALHTHYPRSLDLFIHIPFQLPMEQTAIQTFRPLWTYRTHWHLGLVRYSLSSEWSESREGPRTHNQNYDVPTSQRWEG